MVARWVLFLLPAIALSQSPREAQESEARGDWPGAEAQWRALTGSQPADYRYWTSLGIALAHQGRYAEAIEAYRKVLSLRPHSVDAELSLGIAYFKLGDLAKAIPPLQDAVLQQPGNPQAGLLLGMSLYGTGKYTGAAPFLERALAGDPQNRALAFVVAQTHLWAGQYEKAKREFQTMLEAAPNSPQVHMLLGEVYDGLGKTDEAIAEFRLAASGGGVPDAHFALGYLLWKAKRYEEAVVEFERELAADSHYYKALAYLGDAELALERSSSARGHLRDAVSQHDVLWLARFDLGKLEQGDGHPQAAMAEYRRAIELDGGRPEPHYRLAQLLKAQGDDEGARAEFAVVAHLHARSIDDEVRKITGSGPAHR